MIHDAQTSSSSCALCRLVLSLVWAFSEVAIAGGGGIDALDPALINYTRSSLNLSLCAVVFEEEYDDVNSASRYQNGSVQVDYLIAEGGWVQEDALRAQNAVMLKDFSFTLSPSTTWSSFRRAHFNRDFCDEVLRMASRDGK